MDQDTSRSLSVLLECVNETERASLTRIFPLIYEDLRRVARRYMNQQSSNHTLQPTALVNEAFMRIRDAGGAINGEGHALAIAAVAMRSILVDHARRRTAQKRGGGARPVALSGGEAVDHRAVEVLELDDLLRRLAQLDPRRARVVELRFFAGMTNEEIAEALGVARSTVAEDWAVARAWLRVQLQLGAAASRP
ncbi:MAG: ECF-type sigma factor [Phycisphaerales bacterium]